MKNTVIFQIPKMNLLKAILNKCYDRLVKQYYTTIAHIVKILELRPLVQSLLSNIDKISTADSVKIIYVFISSVDVMRLVFSL